VLPLHDDNPVQRPAVLTWLIIGACLVVYFLWQPSPFSDDAEDTTFLLDHAAIPCELVQGRPLDPAEIVATFRFNQVESCGIDPARVPLDAPGAAAVEQLSDPGKNVWIAVVTSMFLHGSVLHIGGNLLFLWVFGNNIEDTFGKVGFLVFYLVGGVVATLTHVALNQDSTVPLVGASGAIAAVMGAYLVLFPNARIRTLVIFLFFVLLEIRAIWVLGFWFVLQFFTDPNEGVAWAAHVGGFVFGVVVGLAVRVLRPPPPRPVGWSPDVARDERWRGW
jgi:membrane associated rhomboid family serine protease